MSHLQVLRFVGLLASLSTALFAQCTPIDAYNAWSNKSGFPPSGSYTMPAATEYDDVASVTINGDLTIRHRCSAATEREISSHSRRDPPVSPRR